MAGECHWALNWAKIIMRSVDAVSERQRCELQSHCHSCKRSELQPRCHGTAYCRHSREKVRSTKPDDRRKMSPTGTAGEWCATLVLQLTSSTEPTSSARALPRSAPYLCEPQKRLEKRLEKIEKVTKKASSRLSSISQFFSECHDWVWPKRFCERPQWRRWVSG